MIFSHSMLGLLTTLGGGSRHDFWSFYAIGFDHFGEWIGAYFLMFYVFWP